MRIRKKSRDNNVDALKKANWASWTFACDFCDWSFSAMELKHLIVGLAIAFLSYIVVQQRSNKTGVQEPPALRAKIPIIGHVIGIAIHGMRYFGIAWYVTNPLAIKKQVTNDLDTARAAMNPSSR